MNAFIKTRKTSAALLVATLGSVLIVAAQAERDAPPRRPVTPREFERGERPPLGSAGRAPFLAALQRVLNEEQRASLRETAEAQREKVRKLTEKLRDARRNLLEAALSGKPDKGAIRRNAATIGEVEAELAKVRAKALSKIRPRLTLEQIEKLRNLPPPEFREKRRALESRRGERPLSEPVEPNLPAPSQP